MKPVIITKKIKADILLKYSNKEKIWIILDKSQMKT